MSDDSPCPIEEAMIKELEQLPHRKKIRKIRDLRHRLLFEERLMSLRPEERTHLYGVLSPEVQKQIDDSPSEEAREKIIKSWAQVQYHRRLAWRKYLNGETDEKPVDIAGQKRAARKQKTAA